MAARVSVNVSAPKTLALQVVSSDVSTCQCRVSRRVSECQSLRFRHLAGPGETLALLVDVLVLDQDFLGPVEGAIVEVRQRHLPLGARRSFIGEIGPQRVERLLLGVAQSRGPWCVGGDLHDASAAARNHPQIDGCELGRVFLFRAAQLQLVVGLNELKHGVAGPTERPAATLVLLILSRVMHQHHRGVEGCSHSVGVGDDQSHV